MRKTPQKKSGANSADMAERDFLGAMYAEEMPAQDCVSEVYANWNKMREGLPATEKAQMTKHMKSFLRVAKLDPAVLPMVMAMNPDYNPALRKYDR